MAAMILVTASLFIPWLLSAALIFNAPRTRLEWMLQIWLTLAFSVHIYLSGRWDLISVHFRWIMACVVILAVLVSGVRVWAAYPFYDSAGRPGALPALFFWALLALLFTWQGLRALGAYRYAGLPVALAFPFKEGEYYVAHGGGNASLNYHFPYGSQAYALDILRLDPAGRRAGGFAPARLEDYVIFGSPVYAPCDGRISEAVDGLPDVPIHAAEDAANPLGNHVFIACGDVEVLLAHLKHGSLAVDAHEVVRAGDLIGLVGNSGNTTEPHLHIHAQAGRRADDILFGRGVPILFEGRFLVRGDTLRKP